MERQKTWFAVEVRLAPGAVEAVEFGLNEAGASGTEYSTLGKREVGEIVSVVGYFDAEPNLKTIESEINDSLAIYDLPPGSVKEISARAIENRDWLAEWKKHWQPTETARFVVAPSWSEVVAPGKIVLRIEPGMAFGTGTHETTRLCLQAIEENYQPAMSFLDVGTGTGILAIAAAKIKSEIRASKARIVLACDTDFDSIEIAEENARINGVAEQIEFFVGSISGQTQRFDFVAANLTADVIAPLIPLLLEKSAKFLILSGILAEQESWISGELRKNHFDDFTVRGQGDWISILLRK